MPQETLTLPLTAAFGWEGRGGEPEPASGPPKRGAGGSQNVAAPSSWSERTRLLLVAKLAARPRQPGKHPQGGAGAPDPQHRPRSTAPASHPTSSVGLGSHGRAPPQPLTVPGPATCPQPLLQPRPTPGMGSQSPPRSGLAPSLCRDSSICCTTGAGAGPAPANPGAGGGSAGPGPPRLPFLLCLRRL